MKRLASQLAAVQGFVLRESTAPVAGVVGSRELSGQRRLKIYRDAYSLRLREILSKSFAALQAILGDDRFDSLVAAYTAQHRSRNFSIARYGDRLARFLGVDPRFKSEPVLAEVAAWEMAMAYAFDAADAVPIDAAALARVPAQLWARVSFEIHPSVKAVTTRWNSVAQWRAASRSEPLPAPARSPSVTTWVVWRRGLDVLFEQVGRAERDALRRARRALPFADICACAPVTLPTDERAVWAVQLIQRWVARGWIVGLVTSRVVRQIDLA